MARCTLCRHCTEDDEGRHCDWAESIDFNCCPPWVVAGFELGDFDLEMGRDCPVFLEGESDD